MPSVPEVMPKNNAGGTDSVPKSLVPEKVNNYQANIGGDVSDKPLGLEQLMKMSEQIENSVPNFDPFIAVKADAEFIYFPGMPPQQRRHQNVWRDATEDELRNQTDMKDSSAVPNDNFFEEFMKIAD